VIIKTIVGQLQKPSFHNSIKAAHILASCTLEKKIYNSLDCLASAELIKGFTIVIQQSPTKEHEL